MRDLIRNLSKLDIVLIVIAIPVVGVGISCLGLIREKPFPQMN